MFCPNCGAKLQEGSAKCSQCGEIFSASGATSDGNAFKGFLILLVSYFTMPVKTLKITIRQLKELGAKGSLEVEETEIPHLTWLGIAGHFVASLVIVLIVVAGVVMGLLSLKALDYSAKEAFKGLIMNPIYGVLIAIAANWFIMVWLELLLLVVNITNNIKKIAGKS